MSQQASWSSSVSKKMRHISDVLPVRLVLLFIAAVLFTMLAGGNATAGRLFQSPQSPPAEPPPVIEQAQPLPAEPPPVMEQPPVIEQQAEPPQPFEQPIDQAQPEIQQAPPDPSIAPVPEEPPVFAPEPEEAQPFQDQPEPDSNRETARSRDRATQEEEPRGSQNFVMDRAEFVDSVIVSGAYIWACCGIGLLLLVPIFLLVVEIRGRGKLRRRD